MSWNILFDNAIKSFGFIKNVDEPCVYKRVNGSALTHIAQGKLFHISHIGHTLVSIQPNVIAIAGSFS